MNWENCYIANFAGAGPVVEIKDDREPYCATLPEGMTLQEAAQTFAKTYDHNGEPGTVICRATLYEDRGDTWAEVNAMAFSVVPYDEPTTDIDTGERATGYAQF